MRQKAFWGLVSSFFLVVVGASACGDTEQEPTGSTTPSAGGSGATGGGGSGATGGGGHAAHGGMGGEGGTTTTTAGGGGQGGGPECSIDAQCGPMTDCSGWLCDGGTCVETFQPPETVTSQQVEGDCKTNTCGGPVNDDADPFDDQNDCTVDTCNAGTPANDAEREGTACATNGGSFCDGAKSCVECLLPGDCESGVCSADHTCAPAECGDGELNGDETDIDCGGLVCGKCQTDKACVTNTDCISGVCDPTNKVCNAPTCMDGVKNQGESDVDCGVACPEMGCTTGKSCTTPADCKNLVCSGTPLTCQMATCTDLVKNGNETDVDCGGPMCADCMNGKLCITGDDCLSGVCSGTPATCQVPNCDDDVKNGAETGEDCGGGAASGCPACPDDQPCNVSSDCQSGFCNAAKLCKTPTCTDGVKNGTETDIDCGGTCPADCANGQTCLTGADCLAGFCLGNPLTCQPLNGCSLGGPGANFVDMKGQATINVNFGAFFYTPSCVKVSPGTDVTWSGSFQSHPLQGGSVVNFMAMPDNSQIPLFNGGAATHTIDFPTAGTFPYYCQFHVTQMQGVILVEP